ncbi:hypothetical protein HT576_19690 [Haloterrigena sp. SYSU A121-1]|uniref:Uncharacterized protein n=1 Tax=Haloterrigena gelatinilytica TaxID=2741724 RepID=A0A8J8GP26_9EURY|nr:hypothetical protein [Haloterrigena gelatinilytica]NUB93231.1 hypothetical protein [Haloterrigena gelatinilytica]
MIDEDWDTLVLLDACRFDDFEEVNDIPGKLNYKISQGVDSPKFLERNFVGRELSDVVYVTSNPHVRKLGDDVFHDIIMEPLSNWDSEMGCVMPGTVTASAIEAHDEYPNKRIIVHYMQPHDPPIGAIGREMMERTGISGMRSSAEERTFNSIRTGEINEEFARKAYRETLQIALDDVRELINSIDGKVVISSDHGEMFGEKPYRLLPELYEHFNNPKAVELCKVPWLTVDANDTRRTIEAGSDPHDIDPVDHNTIEDQLEALGYKE